MPNKQRIQTQNRVRAFTSKVTTGCITCRVRRVKCDETKPDCQKCTNTGRTCDGYQSPTSSSNSLSTLERSPSPESQLMKSEFERRSFDFFCRRTVVMISGIFDPTFWTRLVLQATHHEPAIRHAVIALGALHESSELGSQEEHRFFTIQQYGKAIKYLVKPIQGKEKQAADVALIACLLFVSFETMRGHYGTAISHIEGGVKIISELRPSTEVAKPWSISAIPYAEPSVILPIFFRLDRQASEASAGRRRHLLDQTLDDEDSGYHDDIPMIFKSFEQARNSIDHIRTSAMRFIKSATSQTSFSDPARRTLTLEALKSLSLIRLQQWSTAFNSFIQSNAKFDVAGQEAIHVLKMHRILMGVTMGSDEQQLLDAEQYQSQFESIISHATSVVELNIRSCETEGRKRSTFHLDMGITLPLFFVASSCRDGAIRRKSIELLRAVDRQEGVWNSVLVAIAAEHWMRIEEEGLIGVERFLKASEIPRENRLGGVEIRWIADRRVQLSYSKIGRRMIGGDGLECENVVVEEWLEW